MWVQPISQITSFHVWQANTSSQNTSRHGHMIHSPSGHSTSFNTLLDIPMMICHDLPIDSAEQAGQFQGLDCVCFRFSGSSSSSSLADAITWDSRLLDPLLASTPSPISPVNQWVIVSGYINHQTGLVWGYWFIQHQTVTSNKHQSISIKPLLSMQ